MRTSLLLSLATAAVACAQPLAFTQLSSSGTSPLPRQDGTIVYDTLSRRVYLFGGSDSAPRNDLWFYSLGEHRWQQVEGAG